MSTFLNSLKEAAPSWPALQRTGRSIQNLLLLSPATDKISFKKALCLSIDPGEISAAAGSVFFSRIKISGFKKLQLSDSIYPTPDALASFLALAIAELRAEGSPIIMNLPKNWVVIKRVTYPAGILENLSEVVGFELDRITPFTPETAYYDYKILKIGEEKVTLVVAAARADLIDPYLRAIREKTGPVGQISTNLLGMTTICRYGFKTDDLLYVAIDENRYEGALFRADADLEIFSGSFSQEDERTKFAQIKKEIDDLISSSDGKGPSGEAVIHFKNKNSALKEMVKSRLERPVTFMEESNIGLGNLGPNPKQIPYGAVGGVLESLWPKSWGLNLAAKGVHRKSKPPWVISLLLVLSLLFMVGMYWITPMKLQQKRLDYLEKQIALKKGEVKKVEKLRKEVESVSAEVDLIGNFKKSKYPTLTILKELTKALPKDTWLTRVRINESQVNIEGYSPSATLLIPRLEGTKVFKKVEFAAPTFKDPRQNMDRFQIKMEV
jgi:Tfp pilus assembly protein PilN